MTALVAKQLKEMIRGARARFSAIDHADWDAVAKHYRTPSSTAKWTQAACEAVPEQFADWREMVRILAQGESYYGGQLLMTSTDNVVTLPGAPAKRRKTANRKRVDPTNAERQQRHRTRKKGSRAVRSGARQ